MRPDHVSAGFLALVAVALGLWAGSEALDAHRAQGWPSTMAVIEESRGSGTRKPAIDFFHVAYRYSVDGVTQVGRVVRIGDEGKDGTLRTRLYPVGRRLPVYYDPADPGRAVLERGLDFSTTLKGAVAVGLLAAALYLFRGARSQLE